MIDGRANLAGIQALDLDDAFCRGCDWEVLADDRRRPASKFERDRNEVGSGGRHDPPTGLTGASE